MPTPFDPGPGWREVERPDAAMHGEVVSYRAPRGDEPRVRTWVREAPVPPLPTVPYTVIRATVLGGVITDPAQWICVELGGYWVRTGDGQKVDVSRITGFEVLAEPRARDFGASDV